MTLLGYHTAHELAEWIGALAVAMGDLRAARDGAAGRVDARGPAWDTWRADFAALDRDWQSVYADASREVAAAKASFGGWDAVTEEDLWQRVAVTFDPTGTEHSRLGDLAARWPRLPGNAGAPYASRAAPQPTASDLDVQALNAINQLPIVGANAKTPTAWKLVAAGAALGIVALAMVKRAL